MLRRLRMWLRGRKPQAGAPAATGDERASGEEAVGTAAAVAAEATPGGQPRVKTDRL